MSKTITEEKNTFGALRAPREYKNYVDGQWIASSSGKTFEIMSIDVHTVESEKIVKTYHLEDWAGALAQLRAK